MKSVIQPLLLTLLLGIVSPALAANKISVCVFDIIGAHGDVFNFIRDYQTAALDWGVELELIPYTDEKIAAEDFKAGQCDAAVLTGLRGRAFNSYTGSIDSIGAIPSYEHMRTVLQVLSSNSPKIKQKMQSGPYEVAGIAPLGAAYLFVNDKTINNVSKLSGKKIAVLDYDKSQARMVAQVGASAVSSDVTNFAGKFNNGSVDICAAPLVAYNALELYKGLKPNGGIVDYPLAQLSVQMIIRHDHFPEGYGQKSRQWFFQEFEHSLDLIRTASNTIDKQWWVEIPDTDKQRYDEMLRQARITLRDDGIYNGEMMTLLRKVRCKHNASHAECTEKVE